jgi:hypothetical protein
MRPPINPRQPLMRYRVKVPLEVQFHAPAVALAQELLHPLDRLAASASGSKPVAVLGEVVLEYRFEHLLQCRFHRPVAHRRYSQRSLLRCAGLGYPNPACCLPVVALIPQFLAQLGQLCHFLRFKLPDALAVHSGGTLVAPDRPEGRL